MFNIPTEFFLFIQGDSQPIRLILATICSITKEVDFSKKLIKALQSEIINRDNNIVQFNSTRTYKSC